MNNPPTRNYPGINIFSGEKGLGGALTNPTELAKYKGCIEQSYAVTFENKRYPDAETAYKILKNGDTAQDDHMMVCLIAQKFLQYPKLFDEVKKRGGVEFLERCSHFTHAKTGSFQSWEGTGRESRFIRNLILAYEHVARNEIPTRNGQESLF